MRALYDSLERESELQRQVSKIINTPNSGLFDSDGVIVVVVF